MTREVVMDKIRKLLKLGESPNEHESALAIGKAQALMEEHRIEAAMLEVPEEEDEEVREWEEPLHTNSAYWQGSLSVILADANGCFVWRSRKGTIVVGKASNANAVRYLLGYCVREINRLARIKGSGNGRTWTNNYRIGCVQGISAAIKAERDEVRADIRRKYAEAKKIPNDRALVTVEQALVKVDAEAKSSERFARSKRQPPRPRSRTFSPTRRTARSRCPSAFTSSG